MPPLFRLLCERGQVERDEAYRVFNMGIGMVLLVDPEQERPAVLHLEAQGERVHRIGRTVESKSGKGAVLWAS